MDIRNTCKWIPELDRKASTEPILHHLCPCAVHKACTVSCVICHGSVESWGMVHCTALDWAPGQVAVNIEYRENDKLVSSEQRSREKVVNRRLLACCDDIWFSEESKQCLSGAGAGIIRVESVWITKSQTQICLQTQWDFFILKNISLFFLCQWIGNNTAKVSRNYLIYR